MNGVWKKGPGKDLFDVLEKVTYLDLLSASYSVAEPEDLQYL